jgi:UDP-glucose 4-epimerase
MHILVTGGAGYIGSHTLIELFKNGHTAVVVDSLVNSSQESLKRVEQITGVEIPFHKFDLREKDKLDEVFNSNKFDAVIHFAGLKAVGESVEKPLKYYAYNLDSTMILLDIMRKHNIKKIVFSSSATVYGSPSELPLTEDSQVGIGLTNPYGKTKYFIEEILRDESVADSELEVTILRYFNPIGAHESGLIGEDPNGIPNNLLPYVSQVAVGKLQEVGVFGDDYDTVDGTGVRDYIHVVDLARGHVAAINSSRQGTHVYNLGTGRGTSVLELIEAFSRASGRDIPYKIAERRQGDIGSFYADPSKAKTILNWTATKTVHDACRDSWKWQSKNPDGYK